jgi:hypothetical protein
MWQVQDTRRIGPPLLDKPDPYQSAIGDVRTRSGSGFGA